MRTPGLAQAQKPDAVLGLATGPRPFGSGLAEALLQLVEGPHEAARRGRGPWVTEGVGTLVVASASVVVELV